MALCLPFSLTSICRDSRVMMPFSIESSSRLMATEDREGTRLIQRLTNSQGFDSSRLNVD